MRRLAIFGGTGLVGGAVVRQALAAGHEVTLLARDPSTAPSHEALTVVHGNALVEDDVAKAVIGCDAVLSSLGGYGDGDSLGRGTVHILDAMRQAEIRRIVVMQGFHLSMADERPHLGQRLVTGFLFARSPGLVRGSHGLVAALQRCPDIAWTLVRAPRVKVGEPTGRLCMGDFPLHPWDHVTSGDVAQALLTAWQDPGAVHTAPRVRTGSVQLDQPTRTKRE